ncbi:hypothetical protein SERLADRAFT_458368 [Serpula lacrymans var. lacrymans S7.9]|nr:uncharacterized protein SERLADRAFT_458368 [Serpula lacrymans var. lacrymans S7.9]EGO29962.1 hypothetical protein SERLADRAFT_458368 [Serpula lacrymans var. lacrymans S7.9]
MPHNPHPVHEETERERKARLKRAMSLDSQRRKRKCCKFWKSFKDLFNDDDDDEVNTSEYSGPPTPPLVPPHRWKAYGYWARPTLNGVQVHNATPRVTPPISLDPDYVWDSLRGPHQSPHPENWPARVKHPALPPRPQEWSSPQPGQPLPFPWEVQLNPFLQHRYIGKTLITFDIGREPSGIIYTEAEPATIPMDDSDRAQPASWPFLTHMHIIGVADDPAPKFPWPIMVYNARGITCGDVFSAISTNFQQHVTAAEYDSWSGRRREMAARAYHTRVRTSNTFNPHDIPGDDDGLRRIDYMGDKIMFRGLEASPRKDGTWLMFVGPP